MLAFTKIIHSKKLWTFLRICDYRHYHHLLHTNDIRSFFLFFSIFKTPQMHNLQPLWIYLEPYFICIGPCIFDNIFNIRTGTFNQPVSFGLLINSQFMHTSCDNQLKLMCNYSDRHYAHKHEHNLNMFGLVCVCVCIMHVCHS